MQHERNYNVTVNVHGLVSASVLFSLISVSLKVCWIWHPCFPSGWLFLHACA